MRRAVIMCGLAAALGLSACATLGGTPSAPPSLDVAAERGQAFAQRRCAGCHMIGLDEGGAVEGPRFRDLSRRYNTLSLQKRFTEISQHGSGMMPPVTFTSAEADDLLAYIATLDAR